MWSHHQFRINEKLKHNARDVSSKFDMELQSNSHFHLQSEFDIRRIFWMIFECIFLIFSNKTSVDNIYHDKI